VLETGIRCIDGLLTCGVGQRVAILAPAGVGKSSLLGNLALSAQANTTVIALVGERGREVAEFVEVLRKSKRLENSVVVAATSDSPAMERVKAAHVAMAIAEHLRDTGEHVLLLVDSLTRLARAHRDIGLAMGQPPTRRGLPPSVFAMLPRLLERAGSNDRGAISAFFTVLVEGEQLDDPIAEEVKSITDGHFTLSPELAAAGHFPAIDVLASTSRLLNQVASTGHASLAQEARSVLAKLKDIELLVKMGEYRPGSDTVADRALDVQSGLNDFLRQSGVVHQGSLAQTIHDLARALKR